MSMRYNEKDAAIKKEVPGYPGYFINVFGELFDSDGKPCVPRNIGGYVYYYLVSGKGLPKSISGHRACALVWVPNQKPDEFNVINHIDGNPFNNRAGNLEWTTYSGNNYHAINTGIRPDNIECVIRDFDTGVVTNFPSMAQAKEFMGLRKDTSVSSLVLVKFGALIRDKYEFRFKNDFEPWFYGSHRPNRVKPGRYLLTVYEEDGRVWEMTTTLDIVKYFKVYNLPDSSIHGILEAIKKKYPDKKFSLRDSYQEMKARTVKKTKPVKRTCLKAVKGDIMLAFNSYTQAAAHFNVDRSVIISRINTDIDYDGWYFSTIQT